MYRSTFTGNLGRDAVFEYTPNGTPAASFSCAIHSGKDKPALWVDVKMYGKAAEQVAKLPLKKGVRVIVSVSQTPELGMYESKGGATVPVLRVVADWLELAQSGEQG